MTVTLRLKERKTLGLARLTTTNQNHSSPELFDFEAARPALGKKIFPLCFSLRRGAGLIAQTPSLPPTPPSLPSHLSLSPSPLSLLNPPLPLCRTVRLSPPPPPPSCPLVPAPARFSQPPRGGEGGGGGEVEGGRGRGSGGRLKGGGEGEGGEGGGRRGGGEELGCKNESGCESGAWRTEEEGGES